MRQLQALLMLAMFVLSVEARADLPKPEGRTLLTVSGDIATSNARHQAEFDREMLEQLGLIDLRTRTPWTEGEPLFTGVSFARLLNVVAANGMVVTAKAANDYSADIPVSVLRDSGALLAMSLDGEPLTLRDKGPLWIVFPWSERPDLDRTEIHNYAVWQLLSLHVR